MSISADNRLTILPQPKAILFDMDDTLITYSSAAKIAWQEMCERYAVQVSDGDTIGLNKSIRMHADWFWSDPERHRRGRRTMVATRAGIIAMALQSYGIDYPTLAKEMAQVMTDYHRDNLQLFPGAIEMLNNLRTANIRLGLVTNGDQILQHEKIDCFGLRELFDVILVEGEFGAGKPEPRVFFHVLDELGCTPCEAWMVGDNLAFDIAPAKQLGIQAIWHDHRRSGLPANAGVNPDCTVYDIAAIYRLFVESVVSR